MPSPPRPASAVTRALGTLTGVFRRYLATVGLFKAPTRANDATAEPASGTRIIVAQDDLPTRGARIIRIPQHGQPAQRARQPAGPAGTPARHADFTRTPPS